jgi:predicted MFS family arabinose efflux permease
MSSTDMTSSDITSTGFNQRLSTRLAFLAAGTLMSAWAPLVPYAKTRMALDEAQLGLLLLCLGVGSITAMPITGVLASRFGCRSVILLSGILTCLILPLLAFAPSPWVLAVSLFLFGAAIGTLDVAMNIQAVIVEKNEGRTLMSGFHALFSVGGFVGAGGMALLLWAGIGTLLACVIISALIAIVLYIAAPHLLRNPSTADRNSSLFVMPRGAVILIGVLCFIVFLAEGAILDWSAVLLTTSGFATNYGGLGYAAFAVAMTIGRLTGDRIVHRWGGQRVLFFGGLFAAIGFFTTVFTGSPMVTLLGFVLIGLGASNIVPVLFTAAGNQHDMPAGLAISAVTTIGYAGILAGPALIGFVAHLSSLQFSFAVLGGTLLLVMASSKHVVRKL